MEEKIVAKKKRSPRKKAIKKKASCKNIKIDMQNPRSERVSIPSTSERVLLSLSEILIKLLKRIGIKMVQLKEKRLADEMGRR